MCLLRRHRQGPRIPQITNDAVGEISNHAEVYNRAVPILFRGNLMNYAKSCAGFLAVYVIAFGNRPAYGERATVMHKLSGCDYFMVQSSTGYGILEWYGGHDPDKDDILVGKFGSYGMTDAHDETADEDIRVWVEEYALTKATALEKLVDQCED
jgi:hypothetical protein